MNDDPYQSPLAELRFDEPQHRYSLGWKVFFGISVISMLLLLIALPFLESVSVFDYLDILLAIFGMVGLFGLAFSKRIGRLVYWRYYFYVMLFESLFYGLALPLVGYERLGELTAMGGQFAFEIAYAAIYLSALYFYAYRRSCIWQDA